MDKAERELAKLKEKVCSPEIEIKLESDEFMPTDGWVAANIPVAVGSNRQITLSHRSHATIDCGFSVKIPEGYRLILELSPSIKEHGLDVYKNVIIGEDRASISVRNVGREIAVINHRDRIAQLKVEPIYPLKLKVI